MRPATAWFALILFVASACSGEAVPTPGEAGAGDSSDWRTWATRLGSADPTDRFVEATGLFLGTSYFNGPLGEGAGATPDPDPRQDFQRVDCVTYLEQSLALALADPTAGPGADTEFLATLDRIRYRDGEVRFATRNHYMVLDWIPSNAWLLRDVTREVGGDRVVSVRRTIDRAAFLRGQGVEPRAGVDRSEELQIDIIPSAAASEVGPSLRSGDLIFWVGGVDGIFVLHTGLLVRGDDGELSFRHGSSKAGHVLDESFVGYAEASQRLQGFLVLRLRTDDSGGTG